jgi:monoamine oxidase
VLLLEARDRIGGRCWTIAEPGLAVPMELGAEFIHGEADVTRSLMREAGMAAVDSGRVQRMLTRGRLAAVDGFAQAKRAVRGISLAKDLSFEALLKRQTLPAKTKTLARLMVEGFDAADPQRVSAQSIVEEWGGAEMGASQPRPEGGYGRLLGWLAASLGPRVRLRLQAVVREVHWTARPVAHPLEVRGARLGAPFAVRAKRAIVTLPVGVLQSGSVRFRPTLPKTQALRRIASGPVVKVALRFDEPFWEKRHAQVGFFHSPGAAFPTFWTQLPRHAPFLIAWAGGPKGDALHGRAPGAVARKAIAGLEAIFGRAARVESQLQSVRVQDWRADPFARGAYSYVRVGGAGAREALAAPVAGCLHFAGEATSVEQAGTVAGALESGRRAARELLRGDPR